MSEMDKDKASALCLDCGRCCRRLQVFLPVPGDPVMNAAQNEYALAWGLTRAPGHAKTHGMQEWYVDKPCAQLDLETNACRIYKNRPLICRMYDGRMDPIHDCLWSEEV